MDMSKKFTVYIGRFQPPHVGHISTIKFCLEMSDYVIIVVGSANTSRDVRNPFTDAERAKMLLSSFSPEEQAKIKLTFVEDRYYQNQHWISDVQKAVYDEVNKTGWEDKRDITLVGYKKDDTSWYLNCFPHWKYVSIEAHKGDVEHAEPINSTEIRDLLFDGRISYIKSVVDSSVFEFITEFIQTDEYGWLKSEYLHHLAYASNFSGIPSDWSINFYTCDAVVIQSGHILLVRRGEQPGKGLWALPGGHIGADETSEQAVIRELREETNLKVPEKVLKGCIKGFRLFEHPDRSLRLRVGKKAGRTLTAAYSIVLNSAEKLPKVKGGSDASEDLGGAARWFPIGELKHMRNQMFEDHYDIAFYFIDQLQ
jgi:bifunctional NMN adenylyltransferase/nudix hydrolase